MSAWIFDFEKDSYVYMWEGYTAYVGAVSGGVWQIAVYLREEVVALAEEFTLTDALVCASEAIWVDQSASDRMLAELGV